VSQSIRTGTLSVLLVGLSVGTTVTQGNEGLKVGAAAVVITPPVGIGMAGYYFERGAQGTHDDLYAKAIVLDEGGCRVAIVGLDLISTTKDMVASARQEIERTTGIKGDHVMIGATHAHTGPVLADRGHHEDVQRGAAELAHQYMIELPGKVTEAVKRATDRLVPAIALAGAVNNTKLAYNRRFHMRDGTVGWNPSKKNPDIIRPAGPIDPEVGVVLFESPRQKGRPRAIATYLNYALHADTVGGTHFSADYPGVLSKLLAAYKGEEMVTLFANGACGNVNHIDVNWTDPQHGPKEAQRIGTVLAADVLEAYKRLTPVQGRGLRVRRELVRLPLPSVTLEEVARARELPKQLGMKDNRGFMDKVRAYRVLDIAARQGKPLEAEIQVVALGDDIAWVSLPGEIFVELGLAIKKASPFRLTLIDELANGSIGYVPDRKAFTEGNYEPESARCTPGSGERLVETATRLLAEIRSTSLEKGK
jgi:hypothetical protein